MEFKTIYQIASYTNNILFIKKYTNFFKFSSNSNTNLCIQFLKIFVIAVSTLGQSFRNNKCKSQIINSFILINFDKRTNRIR